MNRHPAHAARNKAGMYSQEYATTGTTMTYHEYPVLASGCNHVLVQVNRLVVVVVVVLQQRTREITMHGTSTWLLSNLPMRLPVR